MCLYLKIEYLQKKITLFENNKVPIIKININNYYYIIKLILILNF